MDFPGATVEHVLQAPEVFGIYLTPGDRSGGWRVYFGEAAARIPSPFWLYGEDERTVVALGYPLKVTTAWEAMGRELGRLLEAEARYRIAAVSGRPFDKKPLLEQRNAVVETLVPLFLHALEYDFRRGFPEILWLALSREIATRFANLPGEILAWEPALPRGQVARVCYLAAERLAELAESAEQRASAQLRATTPWVRFEEGRTLGQILRQDLLPFVSLRPTRERHELDFFLAGRLGLDPGRFRKVLEERAADLEVLRQKDPVFHQVLALLAPEAPGLPSSALLFHPAALQLAAVWKHPATPKISAELFSLLEDLAGRLRRFEVIAALRARLLPVATSGSRLVTRTAGQVVGLSPSARAFDFTSPTVVPSAVRRYGLIYDLVEFSAILEEIRRRGQLAELSALRFMLVFQHHWEKLRSKHRLRLEKFLGDGAFYSGRSARAVFLAAVQARLSYEKLRQQGCPFDRGLRMALNVGTYHLLPMVGSEEVRFEFFGRGLVELSRLTTGKSAKEVEDIADFLVARGYDLHKVLEFLSPVRSEARMPPDMAQRPYGAALLENGELQNLGTVITEAFLRELELEWSELRLGQVEAWGLSWVAIPGDPAGGGGPWGGLRYLGLAHLKGLEPLPLYELVAWEQAPSGLAMLPPGTPLVSTLRTLAQGQVRQGPETSGEELDPRLCVVSALEEDGRRAWYLGLWVEEADALFSAFRVPLETAELAASEPLEAWLFRKREELAKLYQALRRTSSGATLPLAHLRHRDGYLACLLAAPQRSPR